VDVRDRQARTASPHRLAMDRGSREDHPAIGVHR
jgi:hypothetical protein